MTTHQDQEAPFTQIGFWRAMLREHFVLYALYGFGIRAYCENNPQDNWWDDDIHWKICVTLGEQVKLWEEKRRTGLREPLKVALIIPRGWGKSTIGAALDQWVQIRNVNAAAVISSYDEAKAEEFLGVSKTVFEGGNLYGWFTDLWGLWEPSESKKSAWTKSEITHAGRTNRGIRDKSMSVASVATGLTGGRPDYFRTDDLIVFEKIAKQGNWIQRARDHNQSAKYATKTNGLFVACLTKYSDHDVGTQITLEEGVREFAPYGMRPRSENSYKMSKRGWYVIFFSAEDETGTKSTMPRIWPWELLKEIEAEDPFQYACQMLNEPSLASNAELKAKHVDKLWINREEVSLENCVHIITIDTAFKYPDQRERGDYNVIQHWALDTRWGIANYMDGQRNNQWNSKEFMDELIRMLKRLHELEQWPSVVTDERVGGGKEQAFEQFLMGECRRADIPAPNYLALRRAGNVGIKNQKDDIRVKQAVYAWLAGKVRMVRDAENAKHLRHEMLQIGVSRYDDMRDAAADIWNPLVYRPFLGTGGMSANDQPQDTRPYDELLWVPSHQWSDEEMRQVYDDYHLDEKLAMSELEDEGLNHWTKELYH